jgi:BirA family transcriptional regulator, biotin operon repressor / biotin---[acetyl-CoA-carboxylase] ligase
MIDEAFHDRLRSDTFLTSVKFFPSLASTNTWALENAFLQPAQLPMLIWAGEQSDGRGRGPNRWHSSRGALTFSLAVRSGRASRVTEDLPKIALLAGLAVQATIQPLAPAEDVTVKWPNDVYISDRKVSGILVETPKTASADAVIGIGINVHNQLVNAPPEVQRRAITLEDWVSRSTTMEEVLLQTISEFERQWTEFEAGQWNLTQRWGDVCYLNGKKIDVQNGPRRIQGIVRGIAGDGALQLELRPGRIERVYAGQVTVME